MDNTFFSAMTSTVSSTIGFALVSVLAVVTLIMGATVGYQVYKRFTG